jgi:hypothetical protein
VSTGKLLVQLAGQAIPKGVLVTPPLPVIDTERVKSAGPNVAVTDLAASKVTLQVVVPKHGEDQPTSLDQGSGWAVRTTEAFLLKLPLQSAGQVIAKGRLLTVPAPPSSPRDKESAIRGVAPYSNAPIVNRPEFRGDSPGWFHAAGTTALMAS